MNPGAVLLILGAVLLLAYAVGKTTEAGEQVERVLNYPATYDLPAPVQPAEPAPDWSTLPPEYQPQYPPEYTRVAQDEQVAYVSDDEVVILDDWRPHTAEEIEQYHALGMTTPAPQRPTRIKLS